MVKKILLSFLIFSYEQSKALSEVVYLFSPIFESQKNSLQITLKFRADGTRETSLVVPDVSFGETDLSHQLKNIQLIQGRRLQHSPGKWHITHEPFQEVIVLYELVQDWPIAQFKRFRAYIQKDFMRFSAANGLVVPEYFRPSLRITCIFEKFPDNWFTLSSFGTDRIQKFYGSPQVLKNSFFVLGSTQSARLHIVPLSEKQKLHVVMQGNFMFSDIELCDILRKIITYQRSFFQDVNFPAYTVSLINSNKHHKDGGWETGGACFSHIFDMYCSANAPLEDMKKICAHEHFHTWNGNKIHSSYDPKLYWFSEGFTEYYTFVTAFRAGLISFDDFLTSCNEIIAAYYCSPYLEMPNEQIAPRYWHNPQVNRLPYIRGFVFALFLNHKIRTHITQFSLDDFMKDLYKRTCVSSELCTVTFLDKVMGKYISGGMAGDIQLYIEQGKRIPVIRDLLGPHIACRSIERGPFDLGFDFEALQKRSTIQGVRSDGTAYKAGLRNGQKVSSWNIYFDALKKSTITLADGRIISYYPQKPPFITIPEYYLAHEKQRAQAVAWWS